MGDMALRFLIVDDTRFMRLMLTDILRKLDHEVVGEADNGHKAIELYKELKPDITFMDITMPEMDGMEAMEQIRKFDPNAVIIICSAVNQQDLVEGALKRGANDYVVKPFKPKQIREAIEKYVAEKQARDALRLAAEADADIFARRSRSLLDGQPSADPFRALQRDREKPSVSVGGFAHPLDPAVPLLGTDAGSRMMHAAGAAPDAGKGGGAGLSAGTGGMRSESGDVAVLRAEPAAPDARTQEKHAAFGIGKTDWPAGRPEPEINRQAAPLREKVSRLADLGPENGRDPEPASAEFGGEPLAAVERTETAAATPAETALAETALAETARAPFAETHLAAPGASLADPVPLRLEGPEHTETVHAAESPAAGPAGEPAPAGGPAFPEVPEAADGAAAARAPEGAGKPAAAAGKGGRLKKSFACSWQDELAGREIEYRASISPEDQYVEIENGDGQRIRISVASLQELLVWIRDVVPAAFYDH